MRALTKLFDSLNLICKNGKKIFWKFTRERSLTIFFREDRHNLEFQPFLWNIKILLGDSIHTKNNSTWCSPFADSTPGLIFRSPLIYRSCSVYDIASKLIPYFLWYALHDITESRVLCCSFGEEQLLNSFVRNL